MDYKIDMPKVALSSVTKDEMRSFVPYLVYDEDTNEQSTVLLHKNADTVIWFDEDGWIGCSTIEHFNETRYRVIRPYEPGESFTVTVQ